MYRLLRNGREQLDRKPVRFVRPYNMTMSKREYDVASAGTDRLKTVLNVFAFLLRPLFRIAAIFGPLRRALGNSVGGRTGAISRCAAREKHDKAVALAIDALATYRHQSSRFPFPTGQDLWWVFMKFAVDSLQTYDDPDTWDELIEMARNGVEPFEGYDVAQSFLAFSQWKYRAGDYEAAVMFAETAARADVTWGEPDFILGWYCLARGGGDALAHLTRAIGKDPGMLFRIASDPLCSQHPHIIETLKECSAGNVVVSRD